MKFLRSLFAFVLLILYVVLLPIFLLTYPLLSFMKNSENINTVLDAVEIEKEILTSQSDEFYKSMYSDAPTAVITEEDIEDKLFSDELAQWAKDKRTDIIEKAYDAIETNTPFRYELSLQTPSEILFDSYAELISDKYYELPVCTDIATESGEDFNPFETGCRPEGIELSFPIDELSEEGLDPMVFELDDNTTNLLHKVYTFASILPFLSIGIPLLLIFLIILISPQSSLIPWIAGAITIIVGICGSYFWYKASDLIYKYDPVGRLQGSQSEQGGEFFLSDDIGELIYTVITAILDKISVNGIIVSVCCIFLGIAVILVKIFTNSNKEETLELG